MDTDSIGLIVLFIVSGGILIAAARSYWKNPSRNVVAPIEPPAAESIERRRL